MSFAVLHNEGQQLVDVRSGLETALLRNAAFDEHFVLNQLVRVGRQAAYERLSHLLLELLFRLRAVSQVHGNSFVLPLTQETLSDALGLSVVHTNRTLQQLRRDRQIEMKNSSVTILQPDRLAEIGDFKPPVWPNEQSMRPQPTT
jgi:CRP-like cAMP-binding protein